MKSSSGGRIFYGWYIVAIAFLCQFMATGVGFYIFNAFLKPLSEQRGWTRTEINAAPLIGQVVGIASTLMWGTLVMRVGPRILMVIGPILSGIAFACLGQAQHLWNFYLFFVLLFFGNGAMGGIIANTAVNNWFIRKRGQALGLAATGVSISGAVIPYLAMVIIERVDLNYAFIWIGAMIMMVAPAAWFVVRNRPEPYGLAPDGIPAPADPPAGGVALNATSLLGPSLGYPAAGVAAKEGVPWTLSMAVRNPDFWKIGLAYALSMMGVLGVMFQLAPRFEDIGFDKRLAMAMMSATALIGALGKYMWGALCDRFEPRRVIAVLMAANAAGLGIGLIPHSPPALVLFILIFGFAMGGVVSTRPILIAFLFGREAYASVARFLAVMAPLQAGGYLIMGQSFDRTGSYDTGFGVFIALNLVAAAVILSTQKPRI